MFVLRRQGKAEKLEYKAPEELATWVLTPSGHCPPGLLSAPFNLRCCTE